MENNYKNTIDKVLMMIGRWEYEREAMCKGYDGCIRGLKLRMVVLVMVLLTLVFK